jgi:hypothetical protein
VNHIFEEGLEVTKHTYEALLISRFMSSAIDRSVAEDMNLEIQVLSPA